MFGALFTFELLWRLAVFRKALFMDTWSWIDIAAVSFWYIEKLSESVVPIDPKFIRVARLVKLLRFMRIIRFINAFEKLYLMVASIKSSFSALAWSSAVLLLVEMVFALLLNILMESFWDDTNNPMDDRQAIYQHFGTFSKSLLSMFEMLLGNWYTITRELVKVSEWYMILGVGHQLCFGFAVIEVMTGVFLHETFQVASLDDGIMTNETKRAIKNNTAKMKEFFAHADTNGDGFIDKEELEQVMQRKKVQDWLSGMGLDITDLATSFSVMDKNGDGMLSAEEFVEGALHLKGQARAIELAVLRSLLEEIRAKVDEQGRPEWARSRIAYLG
jgi:Ca2+-binding EF-hand superfamily protein